MSYKLSKPFTVIRASQYSNPGDASAILPIVYGDFSTGGLRGPIPAILINKTTFVYAAAAHAVQSIDNVYVDDTEVVIGVDVTVSISNNYESQGIIATLDFVTQPTGVVSWRGKGKVDGTLITNPISQIQDLCTSYSSIVVSDFASTELAAAIDACNTQGFQTAWVINDARSIQEWLTEMMFNVMGFWHKSGKGLELMVDEGDFPGPNDLVANIVAARDCIGGDEGVEWGLDLNHIVNALNMYYLFSWTTGEPSSVIITNQDAISVNAIGEARKAVTLKGLRSSAMLTTWANVLFNRQAGRTRVEGATLKFTVMRAKLARANVGDVLSFSWPWGPTREEGNEYANEILRLVSLRHDPSNSGTSAVTAVDLGSYLTEDSYYDASVEFDADVWFGGGRLTTPQPAVL